MDNAASNSETLRRTIRSLETSKELDSQGPEILKELRIHEKRMKDEALEVLQEMVAKAYPLVRSQFYIQIIHKLTKIFKEITKRPQPGLLQCLVEQMESNDIMIYFWGHQKNFLKLSHTLLEVDGSTRDRIRCLEILLGIIMRLDDKLFTGTLQLLLRDGSLLLSPPIKIAGCSEWIFLNKLAGHVSDIDPELFKNLVNVCDLACHENKEDESGKTVLHILSEKVNLGTKTKWTTTKFLELLNLFVSSSCVDRQDENDQTLLHILAGKIGKEISHEAYIEIVNRLQSSPNVNIQNKDGQTFLHILAGKVGTEVGHEAFIEVVNQIQPLPDADIRDNKGQTFRDILKGKVGKGFSPAAFNEVVNQLSSPSVDSQDKI